MIPPRTDRCPPDLALEEHLQAFNAGVATHARDCAHCIAWLANAEEVGAAFERRVAPYQLPRVLRQIEQEERLQPRGLALWFSRLRPVALAGAALTVVLASGAVLGVLRDPAPAVTAKGGPLEVRVSHRGEVRTAGDREVVVPGDLLRFTLRVNEPHYVWVLSVDSAGTVSRLAPAGERPLQVEGGTVTLPGSAELDAVLGPERVFAVLTRDPLPWADVEAAAKSVASGGADGVRGARKLPLDADQATLLLEKK